MVVLSRGKAGAAGEGDPMMDSDLDAPMDASPYPSRVFNTEASSRSGTFSSGSGGVGGDEVRPPQVEQTVPQRVQVFPPSAAFSSPSSL